MSEYTAKEKAIIAKAYGAVRAIGEEMDWTMPARIDRAFAWERKHRGGYIAKALIVEYFAKGAHDALPLDGRKSMAAADLYHVSEGLSAAYMCGAHWATRRPGQANASNMAAMFDASNAAHHGSIGRRVFDDKAA